MKTTWTVIDPNTKYGHMCYTYHGAVEFSKMLSKLTHKGVEIVRRPIPYKTKKMVISI